MLCYHPFRIDNFYSYACGVCFACRKNCKELKRSKRSLYKRFKQYIKKASKECFR